MIAGEHGEDLVFDRLKELDALPELLHRLKAGPVSVADARLDGGVHQVAVKDAKNIVICLDVLNPRLNPLKVCMDVPEVQIRQGEDMNVFEVPKVVFNNGHRITKQRKRAKPYDFALFLMVVF